MQQGDKVARVLPPRAMKLLQEQLAASHEFFQQLLKQVVLEAEETLFQRANRSRDNAAQQQNLAAAAEIKRNREAILTHALGLLHARIEHFGSAVERLDAPAKQVSLALLSKQSQDESVILEDLAARAEARATLTLFELGHRYAVLAASPVMEPASQPFSPIFFCESLRRAMVGLRLLPEHKVIIYQAFTNKFLQDAFAFYDKLNAQLCEQGILPNLRIFALKRRQETESVQRHTKKPDVAAKDAPPIGDLKAVASTKPATNASAPSLAATVLAASQSHGAAAAPSVDEAERYVVMSQLLAAQRESSGTESTSTGKVPDQALLDQVFAGLQKQPATMVSAEGELQPRDMRQLRHELLTQLQYASPAGVPPSFGTEQVNAMELMTLLFDRLSESIRSSSGNYLLSELQAPLLRMAMTDKSFFTNRHHPARNWLEKVALASAHWGADGDQSNSEVALITRIHSMNRTINRDFNGDPAIFNGMANDLQKQLEQLTHRASVAEKRSVEASKGRERLHLARKQAEALASKRVDNCPGSTFTHAMLKRAWTDVLTLSLLRHGDDSESLRYNLRLLDALVNRQAAGLSAEQTDKLCQAVEAAFIQTGMESAEASLLAKEAVGSSQAAVPDALVVRAELAQKLEQREAHEAESVDQIVETPVVTRDEEAIAAMMERIRHMSFGTWFEFDDPESGKSVQRKMAWYSPRSGRCLFVNRHGIRTHETNLDHLAESMLADKVRVAPPEQKSSFIERAFDSILASLKKLGHKALQEKPA